MQSVFKTSPDVQAALAPYSLAFSQCMLQILHLEGGLRDDGGINDKASDRGGLTKFGISQRAFPSVDIASLTLEQAVRLYHRHYWRPIHGEELPDGVNLMLFDAAVQHGVGSSAKLLQRKIGVSADGIIGPNTLKELYHFEVATILARLSIGRARKYARICVNDPSQNPNLEGWYNRLEHITELAFAEVHHG
ncbi:secretion activator protein [Pseudoalteromonas sp. CO325X]|uniref:glycoside hydrolase family 108 protein n=1 Tax=Pseudoalteromonas sp. CO325X TaxID=1777262 RepID=UPI001022E463|nr:N-acetylmuramidase [Pseudoalteromonas sp. CO325X]RZF83726.1 secretion activator protein [Pseudoalteromonas sp. CO325X]